MIDNHQNTTPSVNKPSNAQTILTPNGSKVTITRAKPVQRRPRTAKQPIIVDHKKPATLFALRIGRWSFVLLFVTHAKDAK